jgi:hypothetical protein
MSVGIVIGPYGNGDGIWILTSNGESICMSKELALLIGKDIIEKATAVINKK